MNNNETNHNKENEQVSMQEHLSAMLDDAAGSFEQRRVLDELKTDQSLRTKLSHFSLIGETMRSNKTAVVVGDDFLVGIHEKLDAEPEYDAVELHDNSTSADSVSQTVISNKQSSWLRPVGGFALAASVAAVAVVGVQNYQFRNKINDMTVQLQNTTTNTDKIVSQSVAAPKGQLTQAEMKSAVIVSADKMNETDELASLEINKDYQHADARTRSLLKRFVDSHIRHASTSSFVPSVRVIAYADYQ